MVLEFYEELLILVFFLNSFGFFKNGTLGLILSSVLEIRVSFE